MASLSVRLPDIGEGVTRAELVEWFVAVGDHVAEDMPLASVMTDKATVEIPSPHSGTVTWTAGNLGEHLAIGAELVRIETDGVAAGAAEAGASAAPAAAAPAPPAAPLPPVATDGFPPRPEGAPVFAAPSVRARARNAGIDLRHVAGSGPSGRISHADLDQAFAAAAAAGQGRAGPAAPAARTGVREIKVIGLRRRIAERMALAHARIPHITIVEEVDVTALEDLREKLNAARGERPKLTVLPFVAAALARVFVDHPQINAHYDDEAGVVRQHGAVHLGIATTTDAGLVVPVLRHAESRDLFETAAAIARLSAAARSGQASAAELTGSTFTISSLGPLGALATTPIINHPEVAILGINKIAVRPMWDGQEFRPRQMMNLSASFDHRVIDGWDAAVFLQALKGLLETPALIFIQGAP